MMTTNCPFTEVGCTFQHSNLDLVRNHLKDHVLDHLSLLCDGVKHMYLDAKSLRAFQTKQKNETESIENRLITLEHNPGAHLVWKIDSYQEKLYEAKVGAKTVVYSPPFLTGQNGYKLILLACLNGDGRVRSQLESLHLSHMIVDHVVTQAEIRLKAKDNFMSIFVSICRSENDAILSWPFSHKIKLTLLNQADDPTQRKHIDFLIKPNLAKENKPFVGRPKNDRNASFGAQNFVALNMMEKMTLIKNDCIFIRVDVDLENM